MSEEQAWLGIDCGGTKSIAAYECGKTRRTIAGGPGNLRLLSDAQLLALFKSLRAVHAGLPRPSGVTIGMASARLETDRRRIRAFAAKVWPNVPCFACDDLETALAAGELDARKDRAAKPYSALVIALSGTGSCFFGRNSAGQTVKVGGWGHVVGDKGSAYEIGLRAIKASLHYYDQDGNMPKLGQRILRALTFNEPTELSAWAMNAPKSEIAALAQEVSAAAGHRDRVARDILEGAAHSIARDALTCARRLTARSQPVRVVFAGSVLLKQPAFTRKVATLIRRQWPRAEVVRLESGSEWGAVELAKARFGDAQFSNSKIQNPKSKIQTDLKSERPPGPERIGTLDAGLSTSPTEQRHPLSMNLDQLPLGEAIALMLREDEKIPAAILAERKPIEGAVRAIVRAFKNGGRLFYVGAGTSGRLGILDASECPPTFRTDPAMVQGIIAGGQTAIWQAVEGAEDDVSAGARALGLRGVARRDVVVGIAASGRTPFVWGALREAKLRGATTILLTFNPELKIPRAMAPAHIIAPNLGPEILTGSTRLKAGTATKLILNIFTTLAMVRIGKVLGNLMVDVKPTNSKLRDRAVRMVRTLTDAAEEEARAALEQSDWSVRKAAARLGVRR